MRSIRYIPFDQIHKSHGALREANKDEDLIVMVESLNMVRGANWHPERLFFLISSARHFVEDLRKDGYSVRYVKATNTEIGLQQILNEFPHIPLVCAEQSSFRLTRTLASVGAEFVSNDFFLTSRTQFQTWAKAQKKYLMENFYRQQRERLQILMIGSEPLGGSWNYDKVNRLPPPKAYDWPPYLEFDRDDIDEEVARELGISASTTWATTRAGALAALEHFLVHNFQYFGPYEDAMTTDSWSLHHSLLSPYLNNGLLHPAEVIDAAVNRFEKGDIPIASAEAFVRQIIGWREYINGMYWHLGENYRHQNQLGASRKLLPLFNDSKKTDMNCMKQTIAEIESRSWVHHIPRLMLLSNLAILTGVNPQDFLVWMRERFIDATDWVMVPNVIGMGVHADGGLLMTKPYVAGGSYISKMGNYCKGCAYNPKLRTGQTACPFTTLYWDFLARHRAEFDGNFRMKQQYFGLDRLSDLDETRARATEVLAKLQQGEI